MTIYIALLRGINVGGHKRIKMADLKKALESIGLKNVQTYIQSGNVLLESEDDAETLTEQIEQAIETTFGFNVSVILRSAKELGQIMESCPYSFDTLQVGEGIHVAVLAEYPSQEGIDYLDTFEGKTDKYHIQGKEVYLFFKNGTRNSKLLTYLGKVDTPVTIRNWKTVMKLSAMVEARK